MNMYAIVYNEYLKDLVIAHSEEEGKEIMIGINAMGTEIAPNIYDTIPTVLVDETLQLMTNRGLMSVRELIDDIGYPRYFTTIDSAAMQFN